MDEWILTKDSDWGEGYSSAEFQLNGAGYIYVATFWLGSLFFYVFTKIFIVISYLDNTIIIMDKGLWMSLKIWLQKD